jgi:hypothetical protein
MKFTTKNSVILTLVFLILYSLFVIKVNFSVANYSDIIIATTFFFTLFTGFFITRQNDRYKDIIDIISERDGLYSFLYRVYGFIPRVQNNIREIIRNHYMKIMESDDWAHNEFHPSDTITRIVKEMGSLTKDELKAIEGKSYYDGIWGAVLELQQNRKKIVSAYGEKLVGFQWAVVLVLAILLVVSFNLVPATSLFVQALKILFGTAVFISVILLKQLDDLILFGEHAGERSAKDIFRIIDEKDVAELGNK